MSTPQPPFLLNEDDIWINEDYSNNHEEFKDKQQYVWCPQLPWVGSEQEAERLKQQILSALKLQRLVEEDIHIHYDHSVCILDEGGECVNCNAKELLEALLEESRKK